MALIAVLQDGSGEEQVGVARYTTNLDGASCEFALVVGDRWRGRGIAHHLMQNFMEIARDRDLDRMTGQVLTENTRMLELMKSLKFQISNDPDDVAVTHVVQAQLNPKR